MTRRELNAIELYGKEDWPTADADLKRWSDARPDESMPLLLRIRPLVEQQKLTEADAVWNRVLGMVDQQTAGAWLRQMIQPEPESTSTSPTASNKQSVQAARATLWLHPKLLQTGESDLRRAQTLFELAMAYEVVGDLDRAAESINEAVRLKPDDFHYYRAHLMARTQQWEDEIASRREFVRLHPTERFAYFQLAAVLLDKGARQDFLKVWHEMVEKRGGGIADSNNRQWSAVFNRDFIAKTCLIAAGEPGPDLDLALKYADLNDGMLEDQTNGLSNYFTLCKGIAEYRRGNFQESIEFLDDAFKGLGTYNDGMYRQGCATTRFFAAMAYQKLEEKEKAKTVYLEGLDYHQRDTDHCRASNTSTWTDWHLAEVARREAQRDLGIDEDKVAGAIPDTSEWTVLYEDGFDESISDDWSQLTGDWSVVDGVACGALRSPGEKTEAFARLERQTPELPSTFELEYETWTSDPMLAASFLRNPLLSEPPIGHRFALNSSPDRLLVKQAKSGTGVSLLTLDTFGHWFPQTNPDVTIEANQHYKVRILRQPNRLTAWVDGNEVLSSRIRNVDATALRFFAHGPEHARICIDNLKVRRASTEPAGNPLAPRRLKPGLTRSIQLPGSARSHRRRQKKSRVRSWPLTALAIPYLRAAGASPAADGGHGYVAAVNPTSVPKQTGLRPFRRFHRLATARKGHLRKPSNDGASRELPSDEITALPNHPTGRVPFYGGFFGQVKLWQGGRDIPRPFVGILRVESPSGGA